MSEEFRLAWKTFTSHGLDLLRNLLETQEFSDVTLVSDDQHHYKVHRFILSACSTFFKSVLNNNPPNTLIYLRGIYQKELEPILQFIYLGEATFYHERINEFLHVAKDLGIKEIGKYVVDEENEKLYRNKNLENSVVELNENKSKIDLENLLYESRPTFSSKAS